MRERERESKVLNPITHLTKKKKKKKMDTGHEIENLIGFFVNLFSHITFKYSNDLFEYCIFILFFLLHIVMRID